ncbi:hypothetical protein [Brachybacterium tyrofermentans]
MRRRTHGGDHGAEHNSVGFAVDGESDCPILDPFVADDEVKL